MNYLNYYNLFLGIIINIFTNFTYSISHIYTMLEFEEYEFKLMS